MNNMQVKGFLQATISNLPFSKGSARRRPTDLGVKSVVRAPLDDTAEAVGWSRPVNVAFP
jgi:hypothetical protein